MCESMQAIYELKRIIKSQSESLKDMNASLEIVYHIIDKQKKQIKALQEALKEQKDESIL
ncbi:hypothetical protein [Helicobacter sp. 13S00477-4]|uniref:hypothetical protein n=1 Tax=Helicobacter sp. 13S00477-4 TaxID=1905759 RepID=UPI000BA7A8DC|nr:hypothetical protein [Helicobacter sp. 13S00477-4]PAF50433.1 hypothetical protein BKH44_08350 [Helicobacter sp. 13S00477-4]